MPISKDELLKGRDKAYPDEYTEEISNNLDKLLVVMNKIRDAYGQPMIVNSGWRPMAINAAAPGAAAHSKHTQGLAVDIADANGKLWEWVLDNLPMMKQLGLYFEDRRYTPSWCHFQLGPPLSGKRIFIPNSNPPLAPDIWDAHYDSAFDN